MMRFLYSKLFLLWHFHILIFGKSKISCENFFKHENFENWNSWFPISENVIHIFVFRSHSVFRSPADSIRREIWPIFRNGQARSRPTIEGFFCVQTYWSTLLEVQIDHRCPSYQDLMFSNFIYINIWFVLNLGLYILKNAIYCGKWSIFQSSASKVGGVHFQRFGKFSIFSVQGLGG